MTALKRNWPFSPLFIAAFTATFVEQTLWETEADFQSAFHRGIHCYHRQPSQSRQQNNFQSAFHRGIHCYPIEAGTDEQSGESFSPLFIAAFTATRTPNTSSDAVGRRLSVRFSSRHSLLRSVCGCGVCRACFLSVRFSSRHSLLREIAL